MYDELIEELRRHHCDAKEDDTQEICEECAYDVIIADKSVPSGIASVCVCGLMNRAADAIEELLKAAKAMHTWAFLNSWNTQAAYDECWLTDKINVALGYGGQFVVEPPKEET